MDYFNYRNGQLYCEDARVADIAAAQGTPLYVYSAATLRHHYRRIAAAFADLRPTICYSIKSLANLAVLKLLAREGSGFDVVSGGELARAQAAGGDMSKVVYAGVAKTDAEIVQAIAAGIGLFNVESEAEFENLSRLAKAAAKVVRAALRVNPDIDPKTHRYTSTGKKETKFGVDIERAERFFQAYGRDGHVRLDAVHLHIGSPIYSPGPYVEAIAKTLAMMDRLAAQGFTVRTLDIGGGFAADYEVGQSPDASQYAQAIVPLLRGRGLEVILEPGRQISANAGVLLTRVLYVKQGGERNFVIVDAAMTDLIRPALYEAKHFIWPAALAQGMSPPVRKIETETADAGKMPASHEGGTPSPQAGETPAGLTGGTPVLRETPVLRGTPVLQGVKVDVVGGVCESSDFLAKDRVLPPLSRGELLVVFTAGAYGFVMSSQYNGRPRAAEVLVDGDRWQVVRRRETYDDLMAAERP